MKTESTPARIIHERPCPGRPELVLVGRTEIQTPLPGLEIPFEPGCTNIYLGYKGSKQMQAEGRVYPLDPGDCFVTPPGIEHSTGPMPVSRCAHYWLRVDLRTPAPFLGQDGGEALRARLTALPISHGRVGEHSLGAARRIFGLAGRCRDQLAELELGLQLALFLVRLLDQLDHQSPRPEAPQLERATDYLRAHLGEDCSIPELAEIAGCSVSALSALFKRHLGLSPGEYATRLKMDEAKRLLLETDLTVRAISQRLGYATDRYFSTVFRRYHCDPPGRFRAHLRG